MRPWRHAPRAAVWATALLCLTWPDAGRAQDPSAPPTPSLRAGPTLEARAVTARSLIGLPPLAPTSIELRHGIFERDFARAFGYPLLGSAASESVTFWNSLDEWLAVRWGDSTAYEWVERGLLLYARFQASTQFEKQGFNMDLDMDDVAEGKLGVRVSRSLDRQ